MAEAAPVESSLRPVERPGSTASKTVTLEPSGAIAPVPRPKGSIGNVSSKAAVTRSLRPERRPRSVEQIGREQARLRRRGAVCGDLNIQGDEVGQVFGRISGCGVSGAVRVRSVSGVRLSQGAVMDCTTAKALKTWVENTAKPVLHNQGGGLERVRVAAHYACRTRNNQPGGRISEHGRGRAIDISAVKLRNGREITVLKGWNDPTSAQIMRKLHAGACGPFGTVLGPNSDRFHKDHFHFDTARYRSGPFCR